MILGFGFIDRAWRTRRSPASPVPIARPFAGASPVGLEPPVC